MEAINAAAVREKSIRKGHPSTLHLYWARRPLAAARAVLFAQLVDDPGSRPDLFSTVQDQANERRRLHQLMTRLVQWENSHDTALLREAEEAIRYSNGGELPEVIDPFAGGGAIPLEAQRLGLVAHASDLNPLAVLLNKALIDFPSRFSGQAPVFPGAAGEVSAEGTWERAQGLAEDVRRYGALLRERAWERIGHLYPRVTGPDGEELTVIAWIWARTVVSPNPGNPVRTPLVKSWWLSKKKGKEAWIEPSVVDGQVRYTVRHDADGPDKAHDGTVNRTGATSVVDGTPMPLTYIRQEAQAHRLGRDLMAVVAEGRRGRVYLSPSAVQDAAADVDRPHDIPTQLVPTHNHDVDRMPMYGMETWADAFTNRQLVALTTFSDLVAQVREQALADALAAGLPEGKSLEDGGDGAAARADAIAAYLALAVSRLTDYNSSLCGWNNSRDTLRNVFARQAIPMVWDYAEANPFSESSGNYLGQIDWVVQALAHVPAVPPGSARQASATTRDYSGLVVSTDPPYYDNVGYSDLSDYFYVWLRRTLRPILPSVVPTMLTPKDEELVANPYRHGGKEQAAQFFVDGFNEVFSHVRAGARTDVPMTVYYAYKQQATAGDGTTNTGWHTLLDGLIHGGWQITATWPMRSERAGRMLSVGTNALASSIVLACRPRPQDAPAVTRRSLLTALRAELPQALSQLIEGGIAPVDLSQAALGPGIAIVSRYSRIREADGTDMSIREALTLVNEVIDSALTEQEGEVDAQTRFALRWYRQYGWSEAASGLADQVARTADTSLAALERGGILQAQAGKARLLPPAELAGAWDPVSDVEVSIWEATVRLAGILATRGIDDARRLILPIESRLPLEDVRQLAFLLFHEADKRKDSADAQVFNALVTSWEDLVTAARQMGADAGARQDTLTSSLF